MLQHLKNKSILFFYHTDHPFSFWYPATFQEDGNNFVFLQHYVLFRKAMLFNDHETAKRMLDCRERKEMLKMGRQVQGFDRKLWNSKREAIVRQGLFLKFSQNVDLRKFLLETGEEVIANANKDDVIWGIGLSADHADAMNTKKWRGKNRLGKLLMEVRSVLRENKG